MVLNRTVNITPVGGAVSYVLQGIMGMSVAQSVTAHSAPAPYGTTGNTALIFVSVMDLFH